jgi:PKD repeat protein
MRNSRSLPALLTAGSSARSVVFPVLFMMLSFQLAAVPMVRLQMNGFSGYYDETVVYYQTGAASCFDSNYDSYFLAGPNPAPHISQQCNSVFIAINGIEPVSQTFSINIKTTTHLTGSFTITAADFEELPAGTCVSLRDRVTGASVNILSTPYSFVLQDTTSTARFVLTISSYSLSFTSGLMQPSCQLSNGGSFKVSGAGNGPWNCTWKDAMGDTVKTSWNVSGSDSLDNLSSGNYTVEMTSADGCFSNAASFTFAINPVVLPIVSFTSPDSITAGLQNFNPSNESVNCAAYAWDFGDNTSSSASFEPSYNYQAPGFYQVKLRGSSSTGCADSMYKSVVVLSIATGMKKELSESTILADLGNKHYQLRLSQDLGGELGICLLSLEGKVLFQQSQAVTAGSEIQLDLSNLNTGIYLLSLNHNNQVVISRKVLVH